jgi:hypothetical protein
MNSWFSDLKAKGMARTWPTLRIVCRHVGFVGGRKSDGRSFDKSIIIIDL